MTTLIIITSYIAHVFLCRWIAKKGYQRFELEEFKNEWWLWFAPITGLILLVVGYLEWYFDEGTWFNGKNW